MSMSIFFRILKPPKSPLRKFTQLIKLLLLAPLIFLPHLLLLAGGEVVLDIEGLPDLLGSFTLNHVGDGLACDVQQPLDVQVISSQDELEKCALIHLEKVCIPPC